MSPKSQQENKPIKRHSALITFSREHHFGLLLCWKIRQGLKNGISTGRISEYILFFFDHDLSKHFESEEKELFPKLEPADPIRQQVEKDHKNIYEMIATVRKGHASGELLNALAETLDKHIRFEERFFFNRIQQKLSEAELKELSALHDHKPHDLDSEWKDHFWKTT